MLRHPSQKQPVFIDRSLRKEHVTNLRNLQPVTKMQMQYLLSRVMGNLGVLQGQIFL